jgi:hypothetical protein
MDPEACLDRAEEALAEGDRAEARAALADYAAWRRNGGFQPKGGDARAKLLGAAVRSRKSLQRNAENRFWILVNGEPYIAADGNPGTIHDLYKDTGGGLPSDIFALKPGESERRGRGPVELVSTRKIVTRVGGDTCRLINVTYDVVTPESAEDGDVAERGWLEPILITREDLEEDRDQDWVEDWVAATLRILQHEGVGAVGADTYGRGAVPSWFTEVDGDVDDATGAVTRRTFHPEGYNRDELVALGKALR